MDKINFSNYPQKEYKRIVASLKEYIGESVAIYNGKEVKIALFSANIGTTERIIKILFEEAFIRFFKKKGTLYKVELLQLDENLYDF